MKNVIILIGGQFHPYREFATIIKEKFNEYKIEITEDKDILSSEDIFNYDGILIYADTKKIEKLTDRQEENLIEYLKNGGGIFGLHSAFVCFKENKKLCDIFGCKFTSHSSVFEFELKTTDSHFINRRIPSIKIEDEFYFLEISGNITPLFFGYWFGKLMPLGYIKNYEKGRIFYFSPGHTLETVKNKDIFKIIKRGIDWIIKNEKEEREIKSGIIGYGPTFGMGKYHAELINSTSGMKVVSFYDINKENLEQAKKDFPNCKTYNNLNEFLNDKEIELVVIITPHNTHKDLTIASLNAGKNVVVEKPMCLNLKEADEMIEKAAKKKLMLSVFHNRRWDGDFLAIEKIIKNGEIGKIFNVEMFIGNYSMPREWWRSEKEISGGTFYDWGAHLLYWLLLLIPSKIKSIYGIIQKRRWFNFSNEDEVKSVITFEGGEVADIQISLIASVPKPKFRILGEKGGIIQTDIIKVYKYEDGITEKVIQPLNRETFRFYNNIADHLIFGEKLEIDLNVARNVIGIIEKTYNSAKRGKIMEY
ncbi:MAG: Gfo/Idh/MocA family oxidoreductase [Candidatus Omnitrophica bacterium]|nr:Gfo/Idh/MocA family oxidoreductase [Candidatus Omnitrophota bacterium]